MKWFPFQVIMLHAADNIQCPAEHLKLLLKVLSIFKIKIIYDEIIDNKDIPEAVGIMCINCGNIIGCLLYNHNMEDFITCFITSMVMQHIGSFWTITSNKNYILIFKSTVLLLYLISHGITLRYVHNFMVRYLKTILQLPNVKNII